MATYTPNYNLGKPEPSDPFANFRQLFNDNMDEIDLNMGGGGGSGGHTIIDPNGTDMTQRTGLQFTGNVSVSDDGVNDKTVVDILGGSNLILDAQIYTTEEKQVGVWRDKKPLYQKTIVLNNEITVSNTAWTSTGVTASSLDVETYVRCVAQNSGGTCWDAVNVATIGGYVSLTAWRNGDTIGVKEFTIQYTKTSDVAGSGGYEAYGFSPVIYSDVERVIGVWRDNKPLYQKTIVTTYNLSATSYQIDVSALNLETIGNAILSVGSDNYMAEVGDYYSSSSDHIRWYYERPIEKITIEFGNTYPTKPFEVRLTIQYTKTTDVAGSGDYNTYGVPTVHYSTSEQVIGTWVNSKPLYQKTVYYAGGVNGNITFAHGISDIDEIVSLEGIAKDTDVVGDFIPFARIRSDSLNIGISDVTLTSVIYYVPSQFGGRIVDIYVTIRYTKTSD